MNPSPHVFWLTGLPGAGKSTLARALEEHLLGRGRRVSRLDGDELRQGLCADLGFDPASRSENMRRAGEVARLLHAAGGIVIGAFVAPFAVDREKVRKLFPPAEFSEVYLSTPLEECVRRDPKGLYDRARYGELNGLTGWDAPYEAPQAAEFTFDTTKLSLADMVSILQAPLFESQA